MTKGKSLPLGKGGNQSLVYMVGWYAYFNLFVSIAKIRSVSYIYETKNTIGNAA
jgi:hypothetical protein